MGKVGRYLWCGDWFNCLPTWCQNVKSFFTGTYYFNNRKISFCHTLGIDTRSFLYWLFIASDKIFRRVSLASSYLNKKIDSISFHIAISWNNIIFKMRWEKLHWSSSSHKILIRQILTSSKFFKKLMLNFEFS